MKTLSKPGSIFFLMLAATLAGACGEIPSDEVPPDDYRVPPAAPSQIDQAPPSEPAQPVRPDGQLPSLPGETPAPLPDPATAALSVVSAAPMDPSLTIAPAKDPDQLIEERIRGNQPAAGSPEPGLVLTPPQAPVCQRECQPGTVLDPSSCECQCPAAVGARDCRLEQ